LFSLLDNPVWSFVQQTLYKRFHVVAPLPSFSNLWSWMSLSYKPFSNPLTTYILQPVHPDSKSTTDIKSEYMERLSSFSKQSKIPIEFHG
jgi:hypothetical protein